MLYRFSLLVVVSTLFLILAGGLVTSHDAGLSVPDWPTSFGGWFPPMEGNVFWEHGHRMIAGTVGILTLILAIWIQMDVGARRAVPLLSRLGWIAFGTVVLQAVLGGVTVLHQLPAAVSIFHACLAQTFFCLVVAIAYLLRCHPERSEGSGSFASLRMTKNIRLALMTFGFIYLQLILGALLRHTDKGLHPHIAVAVLVLIHVLLVALRFHSRLSMTLGFLTLIQIFLGIGAFIFTKVLEQGESASTGEIFFTAAHQTNGACLLALSLLILLEAGR